MKIKKPETKFKPEFKFAKFEEEFDLTTLDTNFVVNHLEAQIELRETPIWKRKIKK